MRRSKATGAAILTFILTPGCAPIHFQTPPEAIAKLTEQSPQTQTILLATQIQPTPESESKFDAINRRLDRLERMLAGVQEWKRQHRLWEEQARQSLQELRRELRTTHDAATGVEKRMKWVAVQPSAPSASGESSASVGKQTLFRAVDVLLGELPNNTNGRPEMRRIPTSVPDKAHEILVYAHIATGYVKGGAHRFRIAVRMQDDQEAAFYLYAVGQPQSGWGYNSDNVWLPMPKNRELMLQAEGEPFFGDWKSEVRIIAYR